MLVGTARVTAEEAILALLADRGADLSICPSEAARRLAPERWRENMPAVHEAAAGLAARGRVHLTQRGARVGTAGPTGAYRISRSED